MGWSSSLLKIESMAASAESNTLVLTIIWDSGEEADNG